MSAAFAADGPRTAAPAVSEALLEALEGTFVCVASRRGEILGHAGAIDPFSAALDVHWLELGHLPDSMAAGLLRVGASLWGLEADRLVGSAHSAVIPVVAGGRRLATILAVREEEPFSEDEIALLDAAALACALALSTVAHDEQEEGWKERQLARSAVRSLSYSELQAVHLLLAELDGDEGLIVASKVADRAGITRSVAVNALRKLASANVIESRSLGMKGTYLRVLNKTLRDELSHQQYPGGPIAPSPRRI